MKKQPSISEEENNRTCSETQVNILIHYLEVHYFKYLRVYIEMQISENLHLQISEIFTNIWEFT